jgi:hypothetical protein
MADKRAIIINYINNLNDSDVEELYNNVIEPPQPNSKMNFIIDTLQPLISFLYFSLSNEQIETLFKKKRSVLKL